MTPKPASDLPELPPTYEAAAHMYQSDLGMFRTGEHVANAYSIAVGNEDEESVPLWNSAQVRAIQEAAFNAGRAEGAALSERLKLEAQIHAQEAAPFGWFYEMDRHDNPKAGPVYLGSNDQGITKVVADDEGAEVFPLYRAAPQPVPAPREQEAGGMGAEPVARSDFDKLSADLTRAKNLLVRLWQKHPEARSQIEGSTGSWFVWGADVSAPLPSAEQAPSEPTDAQWRASKFGKAAEKLADDYLALNREFAEFRSKVAEQAGAEPKVGELMKMIDAYAFGYPYGNTPGVRRDELKAAITNAIGFEWLEGETQTVNASDLLRVAAVATKAEQAGAVVAGEPTDAQIDTALNTLIAEGETVRWYLEQAFTEDELAVRDIMVKEIARSILATTHAGGAAQQVTYSSTQATTCAGCGERKHTPLRVDGMDGYVCLTCIDKKLEEFFDAEAQAEPNPAPALKPADYSQQYAGMDGTPYPSAPAPQASEPEAFESFVRRKGWRTDGYEHDSLGMVRAGHLAGWIAALASPPPQPAESVEPEALTEEEKAWRAHLDWANREKWNVVTFDRRQMNKIVGALNALRAATQQAKDAAP